MIKRSEIVAEALTWIGTPWENGQSNKGQGCDCVGLLLGVAKNTGILPPDHRIENYHRIPRSTFLTDNLRRVLNPCTDVATGNVVVLAKMGLISHVGIILDSDTFIHSYDKNGVGVVKSRMDAFRRFIHEMYEVPGVIDG